MIWKQKTLREALEHSKNRYLEPVSVRDTLAFVMSLRHGHPEIGEVLNVFTFTDGTCIVCLQSEVWIYA